MPCSDRHVIEYCSNYCTKIYNCISRLADKNTRWGERIQETWRREARRSLASLRWRKETDAVGSRRRQQDDPWGRASDQVKCKGPISPVRATRATAAAAERQAHTQASSTANTTSTTDTVSVNGIDILPALPPVPQLVYVAREATDRWKRKHLPLASCRAWTNKIMVDRGRGAHEFCEGGRMGGKRKMRSSIGRGTARHGSRYAGWSPMGRDLWKKTR